jgi:hypothetical protein
MRSIEVGWPEISDILGLRDTSYIYCTCKYHGLHLICMDLTTFNVQVLGLDIFTEIYSCTPNDLFHTVVKTNKINDI